MTRDRRWRFVGWMVAFAVTIAVLRLLLVLRPPSVLWLVISMLTSGVVGAGVITVAVRIGSGSRRR